MRAFVPWILCALAPAQEPDERASWLIRAQAEDGRWPAAWPDGGREVRDLRATALTMLAVLADGSTHKAGPYREALQKACAWLRSSQDEQGRFALHTEPDWVLDHAMATHAVLETTRLSETEPPGSLSLAVDALAAGLRHQRGRDVSAELLLWGELCLRSASALQPHEEWTADLPALRREIERLQARRDIPETLHERAALLLLEDLEGETDAARRAELAQPFLEPGWPDETTDPRAILYYTLACYRLGGKAWRDHSKRLTGVVVKTQRGNGDARGTWNPVGAFGEDSGRTCTTAVHILTLTVYYRYCRLLVVTG